MKSISEFLAGKGFPADLTLDGQYHRFGVHGGSNNGWFRGTTLDVGGKTVQLASFGDWRTGDRFEWRSEGEWTPEEEAQINTAIEEAKAREEAEKLEAWNVTSTRCTEVFANCFERGESPYLTSKKINGLFGARLELSDRSELTLVVPGRTLTDGRIWTLQRISPTGFKSFEENGRIRGCAFVFGNLGTNAAGVSAGGFFAQGGNPTSERAVQPDTKGGGSLRRDAGSSDRSAASSRRDHCGPGGAGDSPTPFRAAGSVGLDALQRGGSDPATPRGDQPSAGPNSGAASLDGRVGSLHPSVESGGAGGSSPDDAGSSAHPSGPRASDRESGRGVCGAQPDEGNIRGPGQPSGQTGPGAAGCGSVAERAAGPTILICEGFATGASIHLATQLPVVSAFNCGNLEAVGLELRRLYPGARLLYCADNDQWTIIRGTPRNPGLAHARRAAAATSGAVVFPKFADESTRPTDFNDLHVLEGIEEVKKQIMRALARRPGAVVESVMSLGKNGQPKKPSERDVALSVLESWQGNLMASEGELFIWRDTHWHWVEKDEADAFRRQLLQASGNTYGIGQVESAYQMMLMLAPKARRSMFVPNPFAANFQNGTLHLIRNDRDFTYSLDFRDHDPEDYLTNVLPYPFEGENAQVNKNLIEWLEKCFEGKADQGERILSIQEMFGAMLCPAFPRFFLLHGPAGSGKSTLITVARRLLHDRNICSVDPGDMRGFMLHTMVGKLANLVTDIKTNTPIQDSTCKQIEDRVPMLIDRKFKDPIFAPLASVHVFGANKIPPTLDGGSRAHQRRWTFVELDRQFANEGQSYTRDYGNWLFQADPQGVVNWAVAGLVRLAARGGLYSNPTSGKARINAWMEENDPVALFFQDIEAGEVQTVGRERNDEVYLSDNARLERKVLWEIFEEWQVQENGARVQMMRRHKFYDALVQRGMRVVIVDGVRMFSGIGLRTGGQSEA